MKKLGMMVLVLSFFIFTGFALGQSVDSGRGKNFYRTFEIIAISGTVLSLQDPDGNVIEVDKDPAGYKVGYKVRYDSVRKRLRPYRWQEYEVVAVSGDSMTLQHKTGDILSVAGYYVNKYNIGDEVRYDSVGDKIQPADDSGQWKQYEVIAADTRSVTLRSAAGEELVLHMDNNLYPEQRGVYIGRYKVGDLVRYNASTNSLRKGVIRTYDWQDYAVKEVTQDTIILVNEQKDEVVLENTYGTQFKAGDLVKYDRLNNRIRKRR